MSDKMVTVKMPYGKDYVTASIPSENFSGFYSVKPSKPLSKLDEKIREVLLKPTGCRPLHESVEDCSNVLVVCDDNTRRTPARIILPHIIEFLNSAGIEDESISILFAAGSHRPMTEDEVKQKIGKDIYVRIRSYNHDYRRNLVFKGITSLGTPIYVNRLMDEADFVIGIGNIIPHRYCGWAGGGKIIQPGVCGEETIIKTHLLITKDPSIKLGSVDNAARREINEVARAAGLKFIVNTILNSDGEVVDIVAGDVEEAHRKGIEIARNIFGISMPASDVVVISSYPEDLNLWQALKALYTTDIIIKDGGTIILVSPLYEGIGEHHEFVELLSYKSKEIAEKIENNEIKDLLSGAAAYAESLIIERAEILMVTDGITDKITDMMGFKRYNSLQDAINRVIAKKPSSKIVCLKEGTEILPLKGE